MQEAIALWEELRRQDTEKDRRQHLVTQILHLIKGHIADVAASPKASRIIQSCVKHGNPAQRAAIVKEVQPQACFSRPWQNHLRQSRHHGGGVAHCCRCVGRGLH